MQALFDREDRDLMVAFAGCSLDDSPGSNWVQENGGLPDYICRIARAVKKTGKTTSQAVAIAVSRVKAWASGVGVDNDTQAKASAALAEWEKLKAKAKGKKAAKDTVKASRADEQVLNLTDYSMDMVSAAWRARVNAAQAAWRTANPQVTSYYSDPGYPSSTYVKEIWNSFIIVQSDYGKDADLWKVPYTVDDNQDVAFQEPVEVKQAYVEITDNDGPDDTGMTDDQLQKLMAATGPCPKSKVDKFLALTPRPSALDRVLALAADGKKDAKSYASTKADSYADPGYQDDGKKRYALDNEGQVRAAWNYINQKDNAAKYSAGQLAKIKATIKAAGKKYGIEFNDSSGD